MRALLWLFRKRPLPCEELAWYEQAAGGRGLKLTEQVSWDRFPEYANRLLKLLDAWVEEPMCSVDMHLWQCRSADDEPFCLVFDDYPLGVTLEPRDETPDELLEEYWVILERYRS